MVKGIIGNTLTTPMAMTQLVNSVESAELTAKEATAKAEEARGIAIWADGTAIEARNIAVYLDEHKADKPTITTMFFGSFTFNFADMYNTELRPNIGEEDILSSLSFTFGNGEYPQDYVSGISFDSGSTPTAIDYTDSGILNWVGTDCSMSDGLSIFQPSPNTHYDIVFYFNGTQFIGLVNGFVPASGNEAV